MASCNTADYPAQYSAYGSSNKRPGGSPGCESNCSAPALALPPTFSAAPTFSLAVHRLTASSRTK